MQYNRAASERRFPTRTFGAVAVALVLAGVAVLPAPVAGEERQSIRITDASRQGRVHTFPPIETSDPVYPASVNQYTYANCRAGNNQGGIGGHYYAAHKIVVDRSSEYGHKTKFEVRWPYDEALPNFLLVQVWRPPPPDRTPDPDNPANDGSELLAQEGNAGFADIELQDLENGEFWLCIANRSNINEGYTVQVKMSVIPLPTFDIPRETPRIAGGFDGNDRPNRFVLDPVTGEETEVASGELPETVATPGPDGPMGPAALAFVARQAGRLTGNGDGFRLAFTIATLLIVIGGTFIVVRRIRRDRI